LSNPQPVIALRDGQRIPQLGLGVWQTPNHEAAVVVRTALECGYRHVDTASLYGNEQGVGEGVRSSGLARDEVFVTTKVWNDDQGLDRALRAIDASLERLGLDHVDLLLVHWPAPQRKLYVETWRALVRARQEGRARSIGVSNFEPEHLDRIIAETGVVPVINQVELHPRFQQKRLRAAHAERGVRTQAWSPLGQGQLLAHPLVARVADKHGRSPAQVIIRWHIDLGLIVIPKSSNAQRIRENFDVFGFQLDADDLATLEKLDEAGGRIGPDPMTADF
jgi:2,5-diketo-D-gluconate reductase A